LAEKRKKQDAGGKKRFRKKSRGVSTPRKQETGGKKKNPTERALGHIGGNEK